VVQGDVAGDQGAGLPPSAAPRRAERGPPGERLAALLGAIVCLLFVLTLRDVAVHPLVAAAFTAPALPGSVSDRDAALEVTVVDEAGHLLPGTSVRVFAMREGRAFFAGDRNADRDGRASFARLPRGEVWVLAYGAGRARASSNAALTAGPRQLQLVLRQARALDVAVVNDAEQRVEGASVEVLTADPLPYSAVTTRDGRTRVDRLGPSPYRVRVWAAGYDEVIRAGVVPGASPLRIRLERPAGLDVSVVDAEGHAAAVATVLASGTGLWPARSGLTDEKGALHIGGLHGGVYDLKARRGAEVSATEIAVPVARGETKEIRLTLQPGKQVRVTVVDGDASGPAVANADVVLVEEGLSSFPLQGRTDARGVVELGPIARSRATVSVRARGFVSRTAVVDATATEATIALVRGGVLAGDVVDDRGFPVPGASIEVVGVDAEGMPIDETSAMMDFRDERFDVTMAGPAPLIPAGELGVMPGVIPDFPHGASGGPPSGAPAAGATANGGGAAPRSGPASDPWVTRSDGTFRCDPVPPGRVHAIVRHPRYVESVSEMVTLRSGVTTTVHVVLRQGGFIEGRVLEEDRTPVRGARIELAATHGALEKVAYAADDGTFTFASAPDEVLLSVARPDAPGDVVARVTVTVPDRDRATVEIILPKPRDTVRIHVIDDRGYPVERAEVRAVSLDLADPLRRTLFTTDGGDCQLPDAVGLPLRFTVVRPGKAPLTRIVDSAPSQLDLTMNEGLEGRGQVTARGGRDRIADVDVTLFSTSGARHARTDAEGTFTLKDLAPGRLRVSARHASYAPAEAVITVAGDRDHVVDLGTIDLTEAGDVEGEVVDADDRAVAGARVARDAVPTYLPLGPLPAGIVSTDRDGRFKLGGLPEGRVALEAYFTDLGRGKVEEVTVRAGRTTERVKITLGGAAAAIHEAKGAGGVAVTLGEHGRNVVVLLVAAGSEAELAGIEPADEIAAIDGHEVHDIEAARRMLTGPLGEDVVVALRRNDDANKTTVVRVRRERVRR
jgi:protocatechuate 3,4-dioxygenase beta subunit